MNYPQVELTDLTGSETSMITISLLSGPITLPVDVYNSIQAKVHGEGTRRTAE